MLIFGEPNRAVDDFLPRVEAAIGTVDTDMAISFIMDSVISFCRESQLIRRTTCICPDPCITSYLLDKIGKDEVLSEILGFRIMLNGRKVDYDIQYYVENNTIYIEKLPRSPMSTIEIDYCVKPKRDSEVVYDVLYEDWLEAIIHLTLHKLYGLSDMDWYNLNTSNYHKKMYDDILSASRIQNITKHRALKMRLSPKWRRYG